MYLVAFDVVTLQDSPVIRPAGIQDALSVDHGRRHSRRQGHFGESLHGRLATKVGAVYVQCDAVCPSQNQVRVPELGSSLPAFRPGGLRGVESGIVGQSPGNQEPNRRAEPPLVCAAVLFCCHLRLSPPWKRFRCPLLFSPWSSGAPTGNCVVAQQSRGSFRAKSGWWARKVEKVGSPKCSKGFVLNLNQPLIASQYQRHRGVLPGLDES